MKGPAVLFALALAGAAAAWTLVVLPASREAGALAVEVAAADVEGKRRAAAAWPGPGAEEARRLDEALAHFRAAPASAPAPRGLVEEKPGQFSGRLPWDEVQGLLAWAASRREPVLEIDVRAVDGDSARAACRVLLGKAEGR